MLRELRIRHFTIIDSLSLPFGPGLSILTGETGAGKSIIVDAIGLLVGDRASQDMIKSGEKEGHVEGIFDSVSKELLNALAIPVEEGLIVRRVLLAQGKGKNFVNDTAVSLATLSKVAEGLIDIHGQHEHQGLLRRESHLNYVDDLGVLGQEVDALRLLYDTVSGLERSVLAMKERIRERGQRIDFLRFQISEIDGASLMQGEKEALHEERAILLHLGKLREASEVAYGQLYGGEDSCIDKLSSVVGRLREMAQIDQATQDILDTVRSALPLVEEGALQLRKVRERYDANPRRLDDVEERLETIARMERKYGEGFESIQAFRGNAARELRELECIDEELEARQRELVAKQRALQAAAESLSIKRSEVARRLEGLVLYELKGLGFQRPDFRIDMRRRETVGREGIDDAEFLFSDNPGEPSRPLVKIVSGGELSRIMLGLKCIEMTGSPEERGMDFLPLEGQKTLIFDEIDAGIGGATAQQVGRRMKSLARHYQVFCITHLPQIAALADAHLLVQKIAHAGRVKVTVEPLRGEARHREIARMLSGQITNVSLRHARELLAVEKTGS